MAPVAFALPQTELPTDNKIYNDGEKDGSKDIEV